MNFPFQTSLLSLAGIERLYFARRNRMLFAIVRGMEVVGIAESAESLHCIDDHDLIINFDNERNRWYAF